MTYCGWFKSSYSAQCWKGGFRSIKAAHFWIQRRRFCGVPVLMAAVADRDGVVVWEGDV